MEENENQNSDQQTTSNQQNSEELENQPQDSQSTEQNQPPAQNTNQQEFQNAQQSNQDVIRLYDQVLREQQEELRRLRTEREERNKPAPLSADEQKQRFFTNPIEVLREEIQNSVAPLFEFTKSFRQQSEYDKLKNQYRVDPRYKDIFPHIEGYVDQILANQEKNESTLRTAILVAIGAAQTGEIKIPTQNQPPARQQPQNQNQQPQNNNMPAHLRSTPPSMPVNTPNNQKPVLTELEKRLARERGMTEEQWARFRDMPAHEVATAEEK